MQVKQLFHCIEKGIIMLPLKNIAISIAISIMIITISIFVILQFIEYDNLSEIEKVGLIISCVSIFIGMTAIILSISLHYQAQEKLAKAIKIGFKYDIRGKIDEIDRHKKRLTNTEKEKLTQTLPNNEALIDRFVDDIFHELFDVQSEYEMINKKLLAMFGIEKEEKEIKELKEKNQTLETENKELKEKTQTLETENKELKEKIKQQISNST